MQRPTLINYNEDDQSPDMIRSLTYDQGFKNNLLKANQDNMPALMAIRSGLKDLK